LIDLAIDCLVQKLNLVRDISRELAVSVSQSTCAEILDIVLGCDRNCSHNTSHCEHPNPGHTEECAVDDGVALVYAADKEESIYSN